MSDIKFAVYIYDVSSVCLSVGMHLRRNCGIHSAEILQKDNGLSQTLLFTYWWWSPQWSH